MPPVAPVTTPYKHFASKQALLAAIAARELARQREALAETIQREPSPAAVLREAMHRYVAWALEYPARFKLTFGNWTIDSQELGEAAHDVLTMLVEIVAADLASAGHLAADGKGHASADDLVDDLFDYLQDAAKATSQ